MPPAYIGLLGFAPIAIRAKKLLGLRSADDAEEESAPTRAGNNILAVTAANGDGNISIYTPLSFRKCHIVSRGSAQPQAADRRSLSS